MNSLSLVITDFPPGLIFLILFTYGFMAYSLVKRLWPGVRLWGHRRLVWLVVHHRDWTWASCYVRLIEPVGPDVACETICKMWRECILYGEN